MGEKIISTRRRGKFWPDMQQSPLLLSSYRFWRRAVIFPKSRVFGHVGIKVLHLVTVVDPVRQAADHEVLPGEGLQHGHLLLLCRLVH